MPQFRKKPVVVEAFQMTESNRLLEPISRWPDWAIEARARAGDAVGAMFQGPGGVWVIQTLEGPLRVSVDDWIIRGVKGELYPCKPDIFEATYEPADVRKSVEDEVARLNKIVARGIMGARVRDLGDHERWVGVSDTFGYGCTSSMELCREYGFNPHAIVKGIQCQTCLENRS